LNAQGLTVGKSGNVLKVKEGDAVLQEVRIGETCQVNVFGSIQLTTQAIQTLCQNEIPITYFSQGGWFYGMTPRMVTPKDFIRAGQSVALRPDGRKAFFRAYEQRMDTLVTHPLFGYRLNYRRMLEIQTRLLARTMTGEINTYPVFVTR
jgi:CRISPR/Cas system-associated endonuclease Cas1